MSKVAKLMGMSLDDIIKQEKKTKPAPSKKAALANATTQRAKAKREATLAAKRGQTATAQKAKQAAKDVKIRTQPARNLKGKVRVVPVKNGKKKVAPVTVKAVSAKPSQKAMAKLETLKQENKALRDKLEKLKRNQASSPPGPRTRAPAGIAVVRGGGRGGTRGGMRGGAARGGMSGGMGARGGAARAGGRGAGPSRAEAAAMRITIVNDSAIRGRGRGRGRGGY